MASTLAARATRAPLPVAKWLMCPRLDHAAPLRLWCVPYAGGSAAVWHPWASPLAGVAEVVGVRLPGRENRLSEPAFRRTSQVIASLVGLLAPYTNENYALAGHSLGGLVVFELALALRRQGFGPPQALIISGVRAPHHTPDLPLVHGLPPAELIAEVERRYGAIPPEISKHPEFLEFLLPILRADLEVYETYRHVAAPPLDAPLLVLGGDRDANVTRQQLLDWRAYTTARFEADMLPGGHFFLQENLSATTARVRRFLQSLVPSPPPAD